LGLLYPNSNPPKSWKLYKIEEIANLVKEQVKPEDFQSEPYIGLKHIGKNTLSLIDVGQAEDTISNKYRFSTDSFLFGKLRPYFRKVLRPKFSGLCSTDIWVVEKLGDIDIDYLFYLFSSHEFISLATSSSTGTRMPRASWNFMSQQEVFIPTLHEQERIGSLLTSLDDKNDVNSSIKHDLEKLGETLFKRWFVDFEFPDENGLSYKCNQGAMKDSPNGIIPKNWTIHPLDTIAHYLNGLALQQYPIENEGDYLPVIKIRELRNGITEDTDKASRKVPDDYIIQNGDVLFSWSGSLLVKIWTRGEGALNQHLFKVTSEYPKWFYYYWTKHHLSEFQRIAAEKATTMGHIKREHLSDAMVHVPDKKTLEVMSQVMNPILETMINCDLEKQNLSELRDILLPKVLNGKIQISLELDRK
jgi:type I restriction enzyme, S subunit